MKMPAKEHNISGGEYDFPYVLGTFSVLYCLE